MKVLGLVQWTDRDKRGSPIAGVRPLLEVQEGDWRSINAPEEFPSQGQVFWPNALAASDDSLIIFRAELNAGQKDEFRVVDPKPAYEVLDLRRFGSDVEVREALVAGIQLPGPSGTMRVLIWCRPDVLVGPIELNRVATGTTKLAGANLHRLTTYAGAQVRVVNVDHSERLLRADDAAPSGYVDWDEDAVVLRRALESAVRVAKQAGVETGQTKRQIEEAARMLASQGVGADGQLERYRLGRALTLIANTDVIAQRAGELSALLLAHPAIRASLDESSMRARAEVEQSARANLEHQLALERATLVETTKANAQTKAQLEASELGVRKAEERLLEVRNQIAAATGEAEEAVNARVRVALDRPLQLLAEVSVLKPFLGSSATHPAGVPASPQPRLSWSGGEQITEKSALRRFLTGAARTQGVDASLMLQLHAAIVAGLMPVTIGPRALAALVAYAHGACGSRLHVIHVSPSAIQPQDLSSMAGGGLVAAAAAAEDIDGIALIALEGANRSPLEASLLPLLQLAEVGLSPFSSSPGVRLAASLVTGATTVPVTPQLWNHAIAIYAEPATPVTQPSAVGDVPLSSELFVPGDEPTGVLDALIDAWPDCRELRPTMSRLGSALTRLYEDEHRVTETLLSTLILPYVATALSAEEQADALNGAKDQDAATARALRRVRRWLGQ